MKTINYLNKIRSHLVTIAPMTPLSLKSTLKLRSALHFKFNRAELLNFSKDANFEILPCDTSTYCLLITVKN